MAPGRSDDFLRRRNNEERAPNYRSITQCLWKPYSDHKTNSTADIAEYKSHTGFVLRVCGQDVLETQRLSLLYFWDRKKKPQEEAKGFGDISSPYGHSVCLFMCLLVIMWLLGVRVYPRQGVSHPKGKLYKLRGRTRSRLQFGVC